MTTASLIDDATHNYNGVSISAGNVKFTHADDTVGTEIALPMMSIIEPRLAITIASNKTTGQAGRHNRLYYHCLSFEFKFYCI